MGRTKCELNLAEKIDVRNRIEKGMQRVSCVQYFCYLVVSLTVTSLAAINLFSTEQNVECYSAKSDL